MSSQDSPMPQEVKSETRSPVRLISLDILRAASCILVIGSHISFPDDSHLLFHAAHRGGWIGVDLFFVLSGFLVSGLLFQEYLRQGSLNITRFLIRRGLKIYPAFYFFLLVTYGVGLLTQDVALPPARRLIPEILFIQNYFVGIWSHCWTLAIEEHFYLGIVLLIFVLIRSRTEDPFRYFPLLFALMAFSVLALRIYNARFLFAAMTHQFPTHLRFDTLAFGVLLSYFWNFHHDSFSKLCRRYRWIMLASGVGLLIPPFFWIMETTVAIYTIGFTSNYVGSGLILMAILVSDLPSNSITRATAKVGSYSYSIYLWHVVAVFSVQSLIIPLGLGSPVFLLLACITTSVFLGIGMGRVVELPVLRLRDRLYPSNR